MRLFQSRGAGAIPAARLGGFAAGDEENEGDEGNEGNEGDEGGAEAASIESVDPGHGPGPARSPKPRSRVRLLGGPLSWRRWQSSRAASLSMRRQSGCESRLRRFDSGSLTRSLAQRKRVLDPPATRFLAQRKRAQNRASSHAPTRSLPCRLTGRTPDSESGDRGSNPCEAVRDVWCSQSARLPEEQKVRVRFPGRPLRLITASRLFA